MRIATAMDSSNLFSKAAQSTDRSGTCQRAIDARMFRRLAAVGLVAAAACCSKSEVKGGGSGAEGAPPTKPTFTLFALAEMRGQIGPCGCTSDPLGDISRTAKVITDARAAGPVLV